MEFSLSRIEEEGPKEILRECLALHSATVLNLFMSDDFAEKDEQEQDEWLFALIDVLEEKERLRSPIRFNFDPSKSTWQSITDLLALARQKGKEGIVAQYLVGAKLALRFPDLKVENLSYSTADEQLGRPGDFYLGSTAFHVTVAPTMPALYEKFRRNMEQGYRVYMLVPDRCLVGARQSAEATASGKIAVESIESFVGNNIEELSRFSGDQLRDGFRRLLDEYNRRVDSVETDKSMLIEIPKNLQ